MFFTLIAQATNIIRDSEIENGIQVFIQPLLQIIGLNRQQIHITLINDPTINAAMLPDGKMLIHSGVITKTDSPLELIGVMAHELSHHINHDLLRIEEQSQIFDKGNMLSLALGLGIALSTGEKNALIAGGVLSNFVSTRQRLMYNRNMETSADYRAAKLLRDAGLSIQGLVNLSERMLTENFEPQFTNNKYLITHPLTKDRLDYFRQQSKLEPTLFLPQGWQVLFDRLRAKLIAFTYDITTAKNIYSEMRVDIPARIAHAIISMRNAQYEIATKKVNLLLAEKPRDAFLYDLKGDILKRAGKNHDAILAYSKAIKLLPYAPLIRHQRANLLLKLNTNKANLLAQEDIEQALQLEPKVHTYWYDLAKIFQRTGNKPATYMALAEAAWVINDYYKVRLYADKVKEEVSIEDPLWLRADDLLGALVE